MRTQTVRAGVVGAGNIAGVHLSALRKHPDAHLVGICDVDETSADEAASEHGTEAFYSFDELLDEDLDLVHICTPVQTHLPLARTAIEAGVAALIEKPVTQSVEEAEELIELASEHDVPVSVVHQHLFTPVVRKARRAIRAGNIGTVRGIDLHYLGRTPPDMANRGGWVFDLPGGEFEEGLPHPIYTVLGVAGYPRRATDIQALTSLIGTYDADFAYDNAQVQYVTETGALCSLKMLTRGNPQRMFFVHGDDGSLLLDQTTQTLIPLNRDYTSSTLNKLRKNLEMSGSLVSGIVQNGKLMLENTIDGDWETEKALDPHYNLIDGMVEAVSRGTEPPVPLEEAKWTLEIMQAIRDAGVDSKQDVERPPVQ